MKSFSKLKCVSLYTISAGASALLYATPASANFYHDWFNNPAQVLGTYTLDCSYWYVGGGIGVSHLFDRRSPNSRNSVNENGPGWTANLGYQINPLFGVEAGYTQYHDSRETTGAIFVGGPSFTVAKTEHYSAYLAATGRFPLACQFSAIGKLGLAYSYANKIFTAGFSGSANSVSPYYALGVAYSVTPRTDFILSWARVRGNSTTGSADLWSLGAKFAVV